MNNNLKQNNLLAQQSLKDIVYHNWHMMENHPDTQKTIYFFKKNNFEKFKNSSLKQSKTEAEKAFIFIRNNPEYIQKCKEAYFVGITAFITHPLIQFNYKDFEKIKANHYIKCRTLLHLFAHKFIEDNKNNILMENNNTEILTDYSIAHYRVNEYLKYIKN